MPSIKYCLPHFSLFITRIRDLTRWGFSLFLFVFVFVFFFFCLGFSSLVVGGVDAIFMFMVFSLEPDPMLRVAGARTFLILASCM